MNVRPALLAGLFYGIMLKSLLINTFFWKYHHFVLSLDLYRR